jgi:hypothetical protein
MAAAKAAHQSRSFTPALTRLTSEGLRSAGALRQRGRSRRRAQYRPLPGDDRAADRNFTANATVMKADDRMTGTLLDITA